MLKKATKDNRGYSLLEMMVSVAMFAVIFLMITSIYLSLVESQRSVIATQNIQESMKFIFEVMSKEIRTASKSDDFCSTQLGLNADNAPANKIFNIDSSGAEPILYFENKNKKCVAYFLEDDAGVGRLKINRDGEEMFVTPDDINLENLNFNVYDDVIGAFHSRQATLTFKVDVETAGGKDIHRQRTTLQTTLTSRYYE